MKKFAILMALLVIASDAFAAKYCLDIPEEHQAKAFAAVTGEGKGCKAEEKNVNGVVIQSAETADQCVERIVKEMLVGGVYNYEKKKALEEATKGIAPIDVSFEKAVK